MLQLLPQNQTLIPDSANPEDVVRIFDSYLNKYNCENMSVDISFMNVMDACYVSTMCSTVHYLKYPNGKISWKTSSSQVQEFVKDLGLGNSEYI